MKISPIRVMPVRDERGKVLRVRFELWFDDKKRYEVSVGEPPVAGVRGMSRSRKNFGGGLAILQGPHFYGELGESIPDWNGIDIKPYKKQMIAQAWAIIRGGS